MTWRDEMNAILAEADGDLALVVALAALRKVENGKPGREYGVLSVGASLYDEQLRIAATSLRNHQGRYITATGAMPRDPETGLYTDAFLTHFSLRWAPLNAENDPHGLNRHHAGNLTERAGHFGQQALEAVRSLT